MPAKRRPTGTPGEHRTAGISDFFGRTASEISRAAVSPASKMAPTRSLAEAPTPGKRQGKLQPDPSPSVDEMADGPASVPLIHMSAPSDPHPPSLLAGTQVLGSVQDIIPLLPTRQDLEAMASSIVDALKRELHDLKQQVTAVDGRISVVESATSSLSDRVSSLESEASATRSQLLHLHLRQDDSENRSRRNNLRLRGIPEATAGVHLRDTVTAILNQLLGKPPTADLELDRVHRVQGARTATSTQPRDVLCRVHFYVVKEEIVRQAWRQGQVDFDGASVHVLPDLSRHTLRMRRLLRPLLDLIRSADATYRWGHPFHLLVRRHNSFFPLHTPDQLPALFRFLDADPVEIPNWLDFPDDIGAAAAPPPRPQRSDRPRARSSQRGTHPAAPTGAEM